MEGESGFQEPLSIHTRVGAGAATAGRLLYSSKKEKSQHQPLALADVFASSVVVDVPAFLVEKEDNNFDDDGGE